MTTFSLSLVLAASVIHATWNLLAKQVAGGAPFLWLMSLITAVIYAPFVVALVVLEGTRLGAEELALVTGSGVLHLVYFLVLQRGYRVGDLSLVYPLARGTGPAIAILGGILLFDEQPSPTALAGGAMVIAGILIIANGKGAHAERARALSGVRYGLLTGVFIALYTLLDKYAVTGSRMIHPLILDYGSVVVRVVALAPLARGRGSEVTECWRLHRWRVVAIAALNPVAFILVLFAMRFSPVSYVAPAREISILIGVAFGAKILSEEGTGRRLLAAALMFAGLVALSVG